MLAAGHFFPQGLNFGLFLLGDRAWVIKRYALASRYKTPPGIVQGQVYAFLIRLCQPGIFLIQFGGLFPFDFIIISVLGLVCCHRSRPPGVLFFLLCHVAPPAILDAACLYIFNLP